MKKKHWLLVLNMFVSIKTILNTLVRKKHRNRQHCRRRKNMKKILEMEIYTAS